MKKNNKLTEENELTPEEKNKLIAMIAGMETDV